MKGAALGLSLLKYANCDTVYNARDIFVAMEESWFDDRLIENAFRLDRYVAAAHWLQTSRHK
jgi:hypothetical protein